MSGVEVKLLGRFVVRRGGEVVDTTAFGGRRVRVLVRILAAQRGRVVSRDALIEALWGEQLPADPATNLNVIVNRARRALGEPDAILTEGGGYRLRAGPDIVVDIEQFQEHVADASAELARAGHAAAASAAAEALRLWDDPLPEDAYAEWARSLPRPARASPPRRSGDCCGGDVVDGQAGGGRCHGGGSSHPSALA